MLNSMGRNPQREHDLNMVPLMLPLAGVFTELMDFFEEIMLQVYPDQEPGKWRWSLRAAHVVSHDVYDSMPAAFVGALRYLTDRVSLN